ncbi:MAG: oligosaccharide flippase family protein [Candidatus Pacebacteria bacterium]|nr:oligosaccharide flippase family protein [Candidatus Paceibacterota bacterium]
MNIVQNLLKIKELVFKSEASQQSLVITAGSFITSGIMAVAMILLSRFLGPEKFGVFSVSISLMFVISKFADLGLNQLIPRFMGQWFFQKKKNEEFLKYILWLKTIFSIVLLLIFFPASGFLSQLINYPHLEMIYWAIIGSIFIEIYSYSYLVLSSRHQFLQLSLLGILQALIKLISFGVIIWFFSSNLLSITAFYYLAPAVAVLIISFFLKEKIFYKPKIASYKIRAEMNKFWFHSGVGVAMMTLIGNLDILLIQRFLNSFETGVYAGAARIAAFMATLSGSIGIVLISRVSRYKNRADIIKYLKKSSILVLAAIVGFVLYLPFSSLLIKYTIGPEYLSRNLATIFLVGNSFLGLILVPLTAVFYTLNKPSYFSINGFIQVACILIGTLLFIGQYGIMAAAISRIAATILSIGYSLLSVYLVLKKDK